MRHDDKRGTRSGHWGNLAGRRPVRQLLIIAVLALCGAHTFAGELQAGRRFGQEAVERARQLGGDVLPGWSLAGYIATIGPARPGPLYAGSFAGTGRSGGHLITSMLRNDAALPP